MSRRVISPRTLILLLFVAAIVGYGAFALLGGRDDVLAARRWGYYLDRPQAVNFARRAAADFYGVDVSDWTPRLSTQRQSRTEYHLKTRRDPAEVAPYTPIKTSVLLVEPKGGSDRHIRVDLNSTGTPLGFAYRDASFKVPVRRPGEAPPPPAAEEVEGAARDAAQNALERLLRAAAGAGGPAFEADSFRLVSALDRDKGPGVAFTWARDAAATADVKMQVVATMRGSVVELIEFDPVFSGAFLRRYEGTRLPATALVALNTVLVPIVTVAALVLLLLLAIRGEIDYRSALTLFVVVFLARVALKILGGGLESETVRVSFERDSQSAQIVGTIIEAVVPAFFYGLGIAVLWSAGQALARRAGVARAASFLALIKGKVYSRGVGGAIAAGLALGGLVATIPLLVMASNLFPGAEAASPSTQLFVAMTPSLAALLRPIPFSLFAIYAFLVPLLSYYLRRPMLIRALTLALGCLWLGQASFDQASAATALCAGALLILVADQIYQRFDLLTLIAAAMAADATFAASALLAQPPASLKAFGWSAIGGLGLVLAGAAFVGLRGRETRAADEARFAPPDDVHRTIELAARERLVGEFGVARRAQEQMLPTTAPKIPHFSLTATCRPAREVGGDLFDFLRLPNEHVGIVVADVSGKGVPAALYMTLTKGLLASISENESDPGAILREVNRHLYVVCQRKMFVTMLLGVLDPATRTLTYARAGHNPGIWHTRGDDGRGRIELLGAPGLGLGMVSGKMFDKGLRPESITMRPGDALLFYSDGIPEAMNAAGEEFGMERLTAAVERAAEMSTAEMREAILGEVAEFLGDVHPQDDITLIVLRVDDFI